MSVLSDHSPTLFLRMMASLRLTSSANTASRAPTYSMSPPSLSNSVVVLLTSWLLKRMRCLPGLPVVSKQLTLELGFHSITTDNYRHPNVGRLQSTVHSYQTALDLSSKIMSHRLWQITELKHQETKMLLS